jgi:regulator of cell morphogenesis and NO signaling
MIKETDRMVDVIHKNYSILNVISRFGIKLGFGSNNIDEVCRKYSVNTDFFLSVINCYIDEDFFPESKLKSFSVNIIIQYLKNAHNYYLNFKLKKIEALIEKLNHSSASIDIKYAKLLMEFFKQYENEFNKHIKSEEEVTFPYMLKIEEAYLNSMNNSDIAELLKWYSSKSFLDTHDDLEKKVYDLKNLIIMHLPTAENSLLYNDILFELFDFEKDLADHTIMEEKILAPIVENLEKQLAKI